MAEMNLSKYGITGTLEIVHNPSYELLFEEETKPELEGYEKGQVSELGAVNVMTGVYTGRSPKDKFIVMDENSKDTVWWTSDEYKNDNHPASEETWNVVKDLAIKGAGCPSPSGRSRTAAGAAPPYHRPSGRRCPHTAPVFPPCWPPRPAGP